VYGDKTATLARFKDNYQKKLSDAVKRRLVLVNDEVYRPNPFQVSKLTPLFQICYNVDDLLKVCPQLNIPIIYNYHHDAINVRLLSSSLHPNDHH
jgi:UV DNA damage endonuclease